VPFHDFNLPNVILNIENSSGALVSKMEVALKVLGCFPSHFFSHHFIEITQHAFEFTFNLA